MSYQQPLALNKSVLDTQILYSNSLLSTPINLTQGTGKTILTLNVSDSIIYERTATGDISLAQIPEIVTGTVVVHPNGIAMNQLIQLTTTFAVQYLLNPGQIVISSESAGFSYTLSNVVFTKRFSGLSFGETVDDFEFEFKATPPTNYLSLVNAGNSIGSLINFLA